MNLSNITRSLLISHSQLDESVLLHDITANTSGLRSLFVSLTKIRFIDQQQANTGSKGKYGHRIKADDLAVVHRDCVYDLH